MDERNETGPESEPAVQPDDETAEAEERTSMDGDGADEDAALDGDEAESEVDRSERLQATIEAQRVVIERQEAELASLRGETELDDEHEAHPSPAPTGARTMSPLPRSGSAKERARITAAAEAARSGKRQDVLRYLRLRRPARTA